MDRLTSMEAFVTVVELGSLTAAAERMGLSSPMIGKHLRALESRLGSPLLNRTTRRQSLSELGRAYFERCKIILEEVRQADSNAEVLRRTPRGKLRISAPVSFGTLRLAPELAEYLAAYPELSVDLVLNDRVVDLIEDGFDAAIRVGVLPDSGLIGRSMGPYLMTIAAAPAYLERAGTPMSPDDLRRHQCLGFTHWRHGNGWRLGRAHVADSQLPVSRLDCNHGPALRMAALRAIGLIMQPRILLADDLRAGRLVPLLESFLPKPQPVHLIYPKASQHLPKLRTFIDFILERFGATIE